MMKAILVLALVLCAFAKDSPTILSNDMINHINSLNTTWKAGKNFVNRSVQSVKNLMGTYMNTPAYLKLPLGQVPPVEGLPDSFDSRVNWANCESIKEIRD